MRKCLPLSNTNLMSSKSISMAFILSKREDFKTKMELLLLVY